MSLVLNWGDGTLGSPVDGVGEVRSIEFLSVKSLIWVGLVSKESLVFFMGPVRHVVELNLVSIRSISVVFLDELQVLLEDVESELELSLGSVGFTPLGDVLHVGHFGLIDSLGEECVDGNEAKGSKNGGFHCLFGF